MMNYKRKPRNSRQKLQEFFFGDDGFLKNILLNKKFLELIKEYTVIFFIIFRRLLIFQNRQIPKNFEKITPYSLINFKNFLFNKIFFKSLSFLNKKFLKFLTIFPRLSRHFGCFRIKF